MGPAEKAGARGGPEIIKRRVTRSEPSPSAPEAGASPPLQWGRKTYLFLSPTGKVGKRKESLGPVT